MSKYTQVYIDVGVATENLRLRILWKQWISEILENALTIVEKFWKN